MEYERERSSQILRGLVWILRTFLKSSHIFCVFEWPAIWAGWSDPEITSLQELLPYAAAFDGCALGLTTQHGVPLKKRWKLVSNLHVVTQALARYQCNGLHQHGQCRGKEAEKEAITL